jgi:N-acetylglutamate synthase-like GNAT family acetyltransferase/SAM-dependent methyltransferase
LTNINLGGHKVGTSIQGSNTEIREKVREHYGEIAKQVTVGASCCGPAESADNTESADKAINAITSNLYTGQEASEVPTEALLASLGCGNPTALARLHPGEVVLDLGSGGGIDVLLSAKRVGPTGFAYGLDMTDEMLALAEENRKKSGLENVKFLKGYIEEIPLPDNTVDVIISNCVINLAADKGPVLREAFRVLKPGGRFAVSDVVRLGNAPAWIMRSMEAWAGCISGALHQEEYKKMLAEVGFTDIGIEVTRSYSAADVAADAAGSSCCDSGTGCCDTVSVASVAIDTNAVSQGSNAFKAAEGLFASAFIRATKPAAADQPAAEPGVEIEPARPEDVPAVLDLLKRSDLPVEGVSDHLDTTLVGREGGQVVANATLELYGNSALFRSVAVDRAVRGQGLGHKITRAALELARQRGVSDVYLLTETAGNFFPRFGFRPVTRAKVPADMLQSIEFTTLCPESSLTMALHL